MKTGETETVILWLGFVLGFRMQISTRVGRIQMPPEIFGIKKRPDYEQVSSF
jgi:hypothetical protein